MLEIVVGLAVGAVIVFTLAAILAGTDVGFGGRNDTHVVCSCGATFDGSVSAFIIWNYSHNGCCDAESAASEEEGTP